jgi:hypothetical protein
MRERVSSGGCAINSLVAAVQRRCLLHQKSINQSTYVSENSLLHVRKTSPHRRKELVVDHILHYVQIEEKVTKISSNKWILFLWSMDYHCLVFCYSAEQLTEIASTEQTNASIHGATVLWRLLELTASGWQLKISLVTSVTAVHGTNSKSFSMNWCLHE